MRTIIFTSDFANKKAGDTWSCDNMLASSLVNQKNVAQYVNSDAEPTTIPVEKSQEGEGNSGGEPVIDTATDGGEPAVDQQSEAGTDDQQTLTPVIEESSGSFEPLPEVSDLDTTEKVSEPVIESNAVIEPTVETETTVQESNTPPVVEEPKEEVKPLLKVSEVKTDPPKKDNKSSKSKGKK